MSLRALCGIALLLCAAAELFAADLAFRPEELKTKLTVGYATRILDMNGDGKLDIAIVDSQRIIWLENPTWQEHTLVGPGQTKKDNVCFAPHDIDGDGKVDFAVGADWNPGNTKSGGTIQWIGGKSPTEKWDVHFIAEEPTTHRMRWADVDGDGKPELCVMPLMGRNSTGPKFAESGVRFLAYKVPGDPRKDRWPEIVINDELHVSHNFEDVDIDGDKQTDFIAVSFEGVHLLQRGKDGKWQRYHIGEGNQQTSPNRGASEIKLGRGPGGKRYIGTIEPWHGSQVVVYTEPDSQEKDAYRGKWTRHVLDDQLKWGHAVWCANLDDDPEEELIIGVRDSLSVEHPMGLRIYNPSADARTGWTSQRIDGGGVAIEDLDAADLNGDGRIDIVAVGRATHNVTIYWNETK